MKKAKKPSTRKSNKRKIALRKGIKRRQGLARKQSRTLRGGTAARKSKRASTKRSVRAATSLHARSAAKMAASVLSRRAAKVESAARLIPPPQAPARSHPGVSGHGSGKSAKPGSQRTGRAYGAASLPGNRPLVRVARAPQYNYMKAPGTDSGFDVGDTVEVFCDHEKDGERVRGWVKGVVVQVDNKLVAVQFRSNVFLTDGWMVPDRILWYSVGSDQIRGTGVAKKLNRAPLPEY